MGSINGTIRSLRDSAIEAVACKSGILLVDSEVCELLTSHEQDQSIFNVEKEQYDYDRIRSEEMFQLIVNVRKTIGNLPDNKCHVQKFDDFLKILRKHGVPAKEFINANKAVMNTKSKGDSIGTDEDTAIYLSKLGIGKFALAEIMISYAHMLDRMPDLIPVTKEVWDGIEPLSSLFKNEILPDSESQFIDQRFIDFLAANTDLTQEIHWRNFERLCAEFFDRNGFQVRIGPGTNDGGVDVRAWNKGADIGKSKPAILIQCKRYSTNKVKVEYVKAFWSDVDHEGAKLGIIATTSSVAPAGKRVCEARKWPIKFAESAEIKDWISSMWTFDSKSA